MKSVGKRRYTMSARARGVEDTRQRIMTATTTLAGERLLAAISLEDIATAAGVSVQTVLRQFGSRAGLLDATAEQLRSVITAERAAPVGDAAAAVHVVIDHYEKRGRLALLLLAQEETDEQVRTITDHGKALHRRWVEAVFAPYVDGDDALADLLAVGTDVYAWKLLRIDCGLSRALTEARIQRLVAALLAAEPAERRP